VCAQAKQLRHLGEHAKKVRSYERPVRTGGQADAHEER